VQDSQVQVGFGGQELAGASGLGFALGRQIDVVQPVKRFSSFPGRLAVSQENKVRHRTSVPRGPETSVGSMLQFDSLVFVGFF